MIAISFRFPGGRYHATPWNRHVNEGAVEWPPSPWRVLRALVAVWKRTLPEVHQREVEPLLKKLAAPPQFILPPASTGHTRHYMPWFKKGPEDRTLVFDAFVALEPEAQLIAVWPEADHDDLQRHMLCRLLDNLNFLGRAESWCEAHLLDEQAVRNLGTSTSRAVPVNGHAPPRDVELVRVLCADPETAFTNDCFFERAQSKRKAGGPDRERSVEYDPDWHLAAETLWLHDEKWSDPPGSRWVTYTRPRDCFEIQARPRPRRGAARPVHVARFVLDSAVLPLVTETLPVAEAARRGVMAIFGQLTERDGVRGRSAAFSGKDQDGSALAGHRHAYYLPTDEDGDGRLDHLTVFALGGFDAHEQRTFEQLQKIHIGGERDARYPLRVFLLAMDDSDRFSPRPLGSANVWVSVTPYIATHYAKTRGRNRVDLASPQARLAFLERDLRVQLAAVWPNLGSTGVVVEPLWDENLAFRIGGRWRSIQFQRFRRKASDDGGRRLAGAFRIRFLEPVGGPIALGHSSHFGMGLFMPETVDSR